MNLPFASEDYFATLNTGEGVFEANSEVRFTLHQKMPAKAMNVTAYCRGAMVAQQPISPESFGEQDGYSSYDGTLALPTEAQGVVRVTAFDASLDPPTPIAERLVYRCVGRKLDVHVAADSEVFAPGQSVQLDALVRDEAESPVSAVLGISIVDDAVLNLAEDKSTRMPTYFHLLTQIDSVHQFEDANFYLSDEPGSNAALDSLLGTQGWRRFERVSGMMFAGGSKAGAWGGIGGGGFGGGGGLSFGDVARSARSREASWQGEVAVPVSTTSWFEPAVNSTERQSQRVSRMARATNRSAFRTPIIAASILLIVLLGVTSVVRVETSRMVRIVALVIAIGALAIGTLSLRRTPPSVGNVAIKQSAEASVESYDFEGTDRALMLDDMVDAEAAFSESDDSSADLLRTMSKHQVDG